MRPVPEVRLDGLPARHAPMTWGQKHQFVAIESAGAEAHRQNLIRSVPVPPGVGIERIRATLECVVARHEALRTYFGRFGGTALRQRVAGSVRLPILMDDDAIAAPHTFADDAELPVRFGVVRAGGGPRSVELVVSHLAADAVGADVLAREVARSLAGEALPPAPRTQPVDRALRQASPEGRAMSARHVDRWRTLMETGATRVPAARGAGLSPRFWKGVRNSPLLREALPGLAARLRVPPAALVLAGTAQVVADEFGLASVPVRLAFHNRVSADDRAAVESLMAWGLCHLTELGDPTALAGQAGAEAFTAYATARYDVYDVVAVADRLRAGGAGETLPQFLLNVVAVPPPAAGPGIDPDRLRDLRAAATSDSVPGHARDSSGLFVVHVTHGFGAVQLNHMVDTRLRLPAEVERILGRIEDWVGALAATVR